MGVFTLPTSVIVVVSCTHFDTCSSSSRFASTGAQRKSMSRDTDQVAPAKAPPAVVV